MTAPKNENRIFSNYGKNKWERKNVFFSEKFISPQNSKCFVSKKGKATTTTTKIFTESLVSVKYCSANWGGFINGFWWYFRKVDDNSMEKEAILETGDLLEWNNIFGSRSTEHIISLILHYNVSHKTTLNGCLEVSKKQLGISPLILEVCLR